MSVVKRALEDYQKALASWRQAAGSFNENADAYNKSLQLGPDGKPIAVINVKPGPGGAAPVNAQGTPFYGSKQMDLIGYSPTELDITGNPAAQWGIGGKVYYTDYRADTYVNSVNKRDHVYAARRPTDLKMVGDSRVFYTPVANPEGGMMHYAASNSPTAKYQATRDENGNVVSLRGGEYDEQFNVSRDPVTGEIYTGSRQMSWGALPGKPGEFTQAPPKDPGLTLQQIKDLDQPDADQALAVAAMADKKGTVAQRYGGFDNDGEEGLVARAMKGFKKE